MILGIPLQLAQAPIAAANALFWAQPNMVGADLLAIHDAYETVDHQRWEKLGAQIFLFRNGFGRNGALHPQAHIAQMDMVKIIKDTPPSDWEKILEKIETEKPWALRGGIFATTQDAVGQVRSMLSTEKISRAGDFNVKDFDEFAGYLLEVTRGQMEGLKHFVQEPLDVLLQKAADYENFYPYNSDFLPIIQTVIETLRKSKASFVNGNAGRARFHLLLGSAKADYHSRLLLCGLARKLSFSITAFNWMYWYTRGFELIDALIEEQKFQLEKGKTGGPIQMGLAFYYRELESLKQFRAFYGTLLLGTQRHKDINGQSADFFRKTKKEWALDLFFFPLFKQLPLPNHPSTKN